MSETLPEAEPVAVPVKPRLGRRLVRLGFVVVAAGLGVWAVAEQWKGVEQAFAELGVAALAGGLLAVVAGLMASMQVWRSLLASAGSPLPFLAAARVFFIGQLGKYIPGSVWPIVAQMELAGAYRVPRRRAATTAVLTMLISLCAGLIAAVVALPLLASGTLSGYRWALLAAPVILACLHPRVVNPVVNRLLRLARRTPLEQPLTGRAVVVALCWALLSWVLLGCHVWLLAIRLGAPPGRALALAVGGFAFAWSVGFLAVVAPAGAGVREVLLVTALSGIMSTGSATAIALASRILMTVGDLVLAGLAAVNRPTRRAEPAAPPAVDS
jgi:uncharacterized membrane protein YbhN (UPF0104 family)